MPVSVRFILVSLFFAIFGVVPVFATKIVMKDGRILEGDIAPMAKVDESAKDFGISKVRLILAIDDGLRYVYVPKYNIRPDEIPEASVEEPERFRTKLNYTREGLIPEIIGEYATGVRFDPFGRRLLPIKHGGGTELVTQVVTDLTPKYLRVCSTHMNKQPMVWDMRVATNSLPRDQLSPILMNQINPKSLEDRKRLLRFYVQGNLYEDAVEELDEILKDWSDDPDVKRDLSSVYRMIRQRMFQRRLEELELRWKSGQFVLVRKLLASLENDKDLPEQLFMPVRKMILRYDDFEKKKSETIVAIRDLYDKLPKDEKDDRIPPVLDEIEAGLSLSTIERLATYNLYAKDKNLSDSEKLAIAITGWFAGSNANNRRLTVAAGFPETRRLILEYLRSENNMFLQKEIVAKLKAMESSRPDLIAKILAYITPPKETPPSPNGDRPGYYRFEIDNPLTGPVPKIDYLVQLPPEYDPARRYPVVVTLNGLSQTPDMQIDWWAGSWRGNERYGHASRNGYIVVAPNWNPARLLSYDFGAFGHAAVLYSLKDVFRRFSIDTDRVFISGHGMGGTAAWDIAVAHPDLWAGAIPFNAVASKYIVEYLSNARHVPMYLVSGELEGISNMSKFALNAPTYNRYLAKQHQLYDATVVRFIGRGIEGFSDEIINIFEWMRLHQRNFMPYEIDVTTMRPWDDFFWWIELGKLDQDLPDHVTDPLYWPKKPGDKPPKHIDVRSKILKVSNTLEVTTAPKLPNVVVYASPEMLDFGNKAAIRVNNKPYQPKNGYIEPDIEVILFDAKTRADRLHPFWARFDGKRN